ncbi:hypothetical protein F2Q69_00022467 [Brassica cretica]|uniref:Uncharacterized protein n=1 Tax=Brassica cretica TaxID=69181 RepID=A0A8S9Q9P5_BRACR|nr:hypothetical protein F2Q69_00022467 [Brassica cretica]
MTLICIRPLISTRSICGLISASFCTPQLFQIVRSACSSRCSNCSRSTSSLTASTSLRTNVPDQATKDVRDPIEATRSIPAHVPFVSSSRLNSFGGPIQQSSKVKR